MRPLVGILHPLPQPHNGLGARSAPRRHCQLDGGFARISRAEPLASWIGLMSLKREDFAPWLDANQHPPAAEVGDLQMAEGLTTARVTTFDPIGTFRLLT